MQAPNSEIKRFHPGLPTEQQAKDDSNQVFSDHLPIHFQIPVRYKKNVLTGLSMYSWNVWASNGPSGFGLKELEDQKQVRYTRIAKSIADLIRTKKPAIITLQETGKQDEEFIQILQKALKGLDWEICVSEGQGNRYGLATLFDKKQYKLKYTDKVDSLLTLILETKTWKTEQLVVCNVHKEHQPLPLVTENYINGLFKQYANDKRVVVVAGDFNIRLAPPIYDPAKRKDTNIITGAVPPLYSFCKPDNKAIQGTDFTDAAFYRAPEINRAVCQALMKTCNPENWEFFNEIFNINNLTEDQQQEMNRFRILGRVGNHLSFPLPSPESDPDIAEFADMTLPFFSVLEYEEQLCLNHKLPFIMVRDAANGMNKRTICVIINQKLLNLIDLKAMQLDDGLLVLSLDSGLAGLYAPQSISLELFQIYLNLTLKTITERLDMINRVIESFKDPSIKNYLDNFDSLLALCWINLENKDKDWGTDLMGLLGVNDMNSAISIMKEKISEPKFKKIIEQEIEAQKNLKTKADMNEELIANGFPDIQVDYINRNECCYIIAPYYVDIFKKEFLDASINGNELTIAVKADARRPIQWCLKQHDDYLKSLPHESSVPKIANLYLTTKGFIDQDRKGQGNWQQTNTIPQNIGVLLEYFGATTFKKPEYDHYLKTHKATPGLFTAMYDAKWSFIETQLKAKHNEPVFQQIQEQKVPELNLNDVPQGRA